MKKYLLLAIVLLLAIATYFYFSTKVAEAPKMEDANPVSEEQPKTLNVVSSSKQIIEDDYEVDFKFPVTGEEDIDKEIKDTVDSLISSFVDEATRFDSSPIGFERAYTLNGSFKNYSGSEYNSFVFLVSIDFGGAHPNHFYETITFDRHNTVVSIDDFLVREANGLQSVDRISDLTQEIIAKKLGENLNVDMLEAGAGPKIENFKNFYIDDSDIVFVFEPYAVAAYAFSTQEARIGFSELKQ